MTTHTLFALDSMDSGTGRKVEIDGLEVLLVRIDDDIYAISDTCSHADVSLSNGFVEADDCAVECPKHGASFDLRTGEALTWQLDGRHAAPCSTMQRRTEPHPQARPPITRP